MATFTISTPRGNARIEAPSGSTKKEVVALYNRSLAASKGSYARESSARTRAFVDSQGQAALQRGLSREPSFLDRVGEIPKGVISGAANVLESGALGVATLLPEGAENVVRSGIQAAFKPVQDYVSPDINLEQSVPRKFSEVRFTRSFNASNLANCPANKPAI